MKKVKMICLLIIAISIGIIVIYSFNKSKIEMNELEYSGIQNQIIGSELPRIIFADEENVIFDSGGIFIYNMVNQKITKSLDVFHL